MSPPLWIACYLIATLGHMAIWIASFNRLHATNAHFLIRKSSYGFLAIAVFSIPLIISFVAYRGFNFFPSTMTGFPVVFAAYLFACLFFGLFTAAIWIYRRIVDHQNPSVQSAHAITRYDFGDAAKQANRNAVERSFAALPGNQIYRLNVETRQVTFPHLNPVFDGLTLTLISDLHFTGNICQAYFEQVVEKANELGSDLIIIAGDIIDRECCLSWLDQTLARLSAKHGIYFVLGNHDRKLKNETLIRETLRCLGCRDVADRWLSIEFNGSQIHLAGNERPWFGNETQVSTDPIEFSNGDLRICVTHSPDQWKWGRERGCDLTLAGHTHGGQIRIPLLGPVISPSYFGVKYASGIFCRNGKVMVVSRGVSGEEPIRFNCPPEITQIKIQV